MALRIVVMDGDPILKKKCRPVVKFDERLARLLDDMGETMVASDGMGLAGPQVGIMRRLFVAMEEEDLPSRRADKADEADDAAGEVDAAEGAAAEDNTGDEEAWRPKVLEFINPELIEQEGEVRGYEGCLSFPGKFGAIARPSRVKIRALDRNGNPFEYEAEGMTARCLCHETNHLDGVTIDDLAEYYYDPEEPHDLDASLYEDDDAAPDNPDAVDAQPNEAEKPAGSGA